MRRLAWGFNLGWRKPAQAFRLRVCADWMLLQNAGVSRQAALGGRSLAVGIMNFLERILKLLTLHSMSSMYRGLIGLYSFFDLVVLLFIKFQRAAVFKVNQRGRQIALPP